MYFSPFSTVYKSSQSSIFFATFSTVRQKVPDPDQTRISGFTITARGCLLISLKFSRIFHYEYSLIIF